MFEITLPFTIMFEMHYHGENYVYKHITREDINKRDMFPLPPYKPSVSLEILHLKTYFPTPGSAHARPSARPLINMSTNLLAHMRLFNEYCNRLKIKGKV